MRNAVLLFLSLNILFCSCRYTAKMEVEDKPVKAHQLPDPQWKVWNEIKEQWMRQDYRDCLESSGLKMNCSDCEYVYIDVILRIGKDGRLEDVTVIKENVCGAPAVSELKECLLRSFRELIFPEELRGWQIEAKLGTGLRC